MSRAFIKEDAGDDELPDKPLPLGQNYVTPSGLDQLRKRVLELQAAGSDAGEAKRDLRYWQARLGSAILVDNSRKPPPDVRFGATVELSGGKRVRIVGQDEAGPGGELVSWDSPEAGRLIGKRPGETVEWTDGSTETIASVAY
ncbi:MAG: GreA/GreB family elongation factor [Elusimicrobia bacterium]|nr:GreA/GreB family elongation factor [Elusimicrobiota bacterium]